jgi:hypothetical protein
MFWKREIKRTQSGYFKTVDEYTTRWPMCLDRIKIIIQLIDFICTQLLQQFLTLQVHSVIYIVYKLFMRMFYRIVHSWQSYIHTVQVNFLLLLANARHNIPQHSIQFYINLSFWEPRMTIFSRPRHYKQSF